METIQPAQMNIYQSNTYTKDLSSHFIILTMTQGFRERKQRKDQQSYILQPCNQPATSCPNRQWLVDQIQF